jgi:hypothetical protein
MNKAEAEHYFSKTPELASMFKTLTGLPPKKQSFLVELLGFDPPSMGSLNTMLHLRRMSVEDLKDLIRPTFEKYPEEFKLQVLFAPQLKKVLIFVTCAYLEIESGDRDYLNGLEEDGRLVLFHLIFCAALVLRIDEGKES